MIELSIQELDVMLCSTGYLPPRTEDELLFFTDMYEDYKPQINSRHVDIDAIINGKCRMVSSYNHDLDKSSETYSLVSDDADNNYSMAARNFDKLPKAVLDKMKEQHRLKKDNEE